MIDVFELYKPFRNHLRKLPLLESLGVVRAYMQHLLARQPLPHDIEVHPRFARARNRLERGVHEWELDVIARELFINAMDTEAMYASETLRRWEYFAGAINKLKTLEDKISGLYPAGMILLEVHRIAHRQFPWQRPQNAIMLARYFKIFGEPTLNEIIERKIGITAKDLYLIGLAFSGHYLETFALDYPPRIEIPGLDLAKLDNFLRHFSLDIASMKSKAKDLQEVNENFAYAMNPLRMWPLVRVTFGGRERLIAPVPFFLMRRFTEGVYYEICKEPDFGEAFGRSFQSYVGEVLNRSNGAARFSILPEKEYAVGKDRKDTVDWIVEDSSAVMFVESKTKRLRLEAKMEIRSTEVLERELAKLADFIVQTYKSVRDYRDGHYPDFPYRPEKPVFPLVLTLEEWYPFGDMIQARLDDLVTQGLQGAGIEPLWMREMPYAISSVEDFERLIQVVSKRGIDEVMRRKGDDLERRKWSMGPFLSDQFNTEWSTTIDLFPEVLDEITPGEA